MLSFLSSFLFPIFHVSITICVTVFSRTIEATIVKINLHIGNLLMYCGLIALILPVFPYFFLSLFCMSVLQICVKISQTILQLESLNLVYTRTMGRCNAGMNIGLIAFIIPFIYPFFCLSKVNLCLGFLRKCASNSLQTWHTYEKCDCIVGLRPRLTALFSFFLSFPILYINIENVIIIFCILTLKISHNFLMNRLCWTLPIWYTDKQ